MLETPVVVVIVLLAVGQSCGGFIADFGRGFREGVLSYLPRSDRGSCNLVDCSQHRAGASGPGICHVPLHAGRRLDRAQLHMGYVHSMVAPQPLTCVCGFSMQVCDDANTSSSRY